MSNPFTYLTAKMLAAARHANLRRKTEDERESRGDLTCLTQDRIHNIPLLNLSVSCCTGNYIKYTYNTLHFFPLLQQQEQEVTRAPSL